MSDHHDYGRDAWDQQEAARDYEIEVGELMRERERNEDEQRRRTMQRYHVHILEVGQFNTSVHYESCTDDDCDQDHVIVIDGVSTREHKLRPDHLLRDEAGQ